MKILPTNKIEKKIRRKGYKTIAGVDEAGKGALAGPIVAACVVLPENFKNTYKITDSKLLTPNKRQELYLYIIKNALSWAVGVVDNKTIEKTGIKQANILAFEKAISKIHIPLDYVLVDGLDVDLNIPMPYECIVKGDQKSVSISAASIVAKFTRDHIMQLHHRDYPEYGFHNHKGYGTLDHVVTLKNSGPVSIHRKNFKSVL